MKDVPVTDRFSLEHKKDKLTVVINPTGLLFLEHLSFVTVEAGLLLCLGMVVAWSGDITSVGMMAAFILGFGLLYLFAIRSAQKTVTFVVDRISYEKSGRRLETDWKTDNVLKVICPKGVQPIAIYTGIGATRTSEAIGFRLPYEDRLVIATAIAEFVDVPIDVDTVLEHRMGTWHAPRDKNLQSPQTQS